MQGDVHDLRPKVLRRASPFLPWSDPEVRTRPAWGRVPTRASDAAGMDAFQELTRSAWGGEVIPDARHQANLRQFKEFGEATLARFHAKSTVGPELRPTASLALTRSLGQCKPSSA